MSNNLDHNEPNNRIIVHNLSFETDENGLRDYFSKYGEVVNVEIPISQKDNKSRGFGFVTFSSIEGATKANEQSIVHEINERKVRTNFAKKRDTEREEEVKVNKLYIGKLPREINEDELKEYFGQFGKVQDAFLSSVKFAPLLNGFPQHKGYGFVTFDSEEDANKAVKHKSHVIKGANIFVRKAIPQGNEGNSKSGDRRNKKNNNNNNNKGGKNDRRREGGSHSESPKTTSNDTSNTSSATQTGTYSPSTSSSNSNTPSTEKKAVVVKRKDNDKPTIQESTNTSSNNSPSETKTESNTTTSSTNKSSQSNNNKNSSNQSKSITVNQPSKNTKPVISIQKSSTGNPWKTQTSSQSQPQQTRDFPGLGKKKTTTKTVTTTTVTTTITVNDKEDKEDN